MLALGLFLLAVPTGSAQPSGPHLGYVYPAGGRQGTTFRVVVGGQFLGAVSNAYITGAGARAVVVEYNRPMNQKEFSELRDKLRGLQQKRRNALPNGRRGGDQAGPQNSTNVWTAADQAMFEELTARILKNPPNRQGNPAIAETVTVEVKLAADADVGSRELRLAAPNGLSNPLEFRVGQLPEFSRPPGKAPNPDLDRFLQRLGRKPSEGPLRAEMRVTLPAVVNGQILPGGVDRYRFLARQGQHLVIAVSARQLIPYLADAVPGWFEAALTLYDGKGNELAFADHFRFHPDPVLDYEVPRTGDYIIQIRDTIYRGREDFVYRITLGELPYLTGVFPLGGPASARTTVDLTGWNLPTNRCWTVAGDSLSPNDPAGTDDAALPAGDAGTARAIPAPARLEMEAGTDAGPGRLTLRNGKWISNPVAFAVDSLPECREQEPNNLPAAAQPVALPVIVNGRIDPPGDRDVFRFEGRTGDEVVAEIHARRLGSPLDSVLRLTDATGRELACNDDCADKGAGLDTHYADSYLRVKLPADGRYYIQLADAQRQGGPDCAYRLRLSAPQPDFELRVVPSSLNVRAGAAVPFTVYVLRRDGFSNTVALHLKDAPAGFTLRGGGVPANQDSVRLTLSAPPRLQPEPFKLSLEGRAMIAGREVVRPGVPADDMMQAFAYRHLVPAQDLEVAVARGFMFRPPLRIAGSLPVRIPAGGTARVEIAGPARSLAERLRLELDGAPEGITIQKVAPSRGGAELVLRADASKVQPGLRGNLIVNLLPVNRSPAARSGKPPGNQRRPPIGALPAIPFVIMPARASE
jgi:hypothetical protein